MPAPPGSSSGRRAGTRSSRGSRGSPPRASRPTPGPPLAIDLALPAPRTSTTTLLRDLAALAPCGPGNPAPLLAVLGLTVTRIATRQRRPRPADAPAPDRTSSTGSRSGGADLLESVARRAIVWTSSRGSRAGCSAATSRCSWRSATSSTAGSRTRAPPRSSPVRRPRRARRSDPARRAGPRRDAHDRDRTRAAARAPRPAAADARSQACRSRRRSRSSGCSSIGVVRRHAAAAPAAIPLGGTATTRGCVRRPGRPADADPGGRSSSCRPAAERRPSRSPGTIVYAKAGNIWIQTDDRGPAADRRAARLDAALVARRQVRSTSSATRQADGTWRVNGAARDYTLNIPTLMQIRSTAASREGPRRARRPGRAASLEALHPRAGRVARRQLHRDRERRCRTRPSRTSSLKFCDLRPRASSPTPSSAEVAPLGHQDPAWRPDGEAAAYVANDRDGAKGTPRIYLYDTGDREGARRSDRPGLPPARRGRRTASTSPRPDDAVRDGRRDPQRARTARSSLRLTDDGVSWAPTWSPAGDAIAFLHIAGQIVDLRLAQLEGNGPDVDGRRRRST